MITKSYAAPYRDTSAGMNSIDYHLNLTLPPSPSVNQATLQHHIAAATSTTPTPP